MDNDLRGRSKEYYHSHRLSFQQLASKSFEIFNAKVTLDQLKHWSSEDGGWQKAPLEDTAKLNIIAEKIFQVIEEKENLDPKDLVALANVYLSYATKMPPEAVGDNRPTLQQIIDAVKSNPTGGEET